MSQTQVTCPKCRKSCFAAEIEHIDGHELRNDKTYMLLSCQHCKNKLMFVVDLLPDFTAVLETI